PFGAGWELFQEFEVTRVSHYGLPVTPVYCYWGMSGGGIYEQALCLVTPVSPDWGFNDRALIPDMVYQLLKTPGYLEGIWPSLSIVMGTNKGNTAWSASIATTIAFFDIIRTLPVLVESKKPKEEK
ncbi:hypothetical protein LCGC14_3058110, partial [marine sediment metagenome]